MSTINDNVETASESLAVSVERGGETPPRFPCPKCGKETKEHSGGTRICSARTCREITLASAIVERAAPVTIAVPPCPTCGKPSKEHHNGKRICSIRTCRHVF